MSVLLPISVEQTFLSVLPRSEGEPFTAIDPDEFVNGEVCRQASPFPVFASFSGRYAGWFHPDTTGTLRGIANECAVAVRLWRIPQEIGRKPSFASPSGVALPDDDPVLRLLGTAGLPPPS